METNPNEPETQPSCERLLCINIEDQEPREFLERFQEAKATIQNKLFSSGRGLELDEDETDSLFVLNQLETMIRIAVKRQEEVSP